MNCRYERCPTGLPARTKGLCNACYEYLRTRGTLDRPSIEERAEAALRRHFVEADPADCWPWGGMISRKGYGRIVLPGSSGKRVSAHRAVYELLRGPIPEGLHLDHACHTAALRASLCPGGSACPHRSCVNPWHLEPISPGENAARAKRPTCRAGHPWTEENTLPRKDGTRACRECARERIRKWKAARRPDRW